MRKAVFILFVFFSMFSVSSCIKDTGCQDKTVQSEAAAIAAYATANGIAGTTHSTGVYYQVTVPGSGVTPNPNSQIVVRYVGKLLDGTVFDPGPTAPNTTTFALGNTVPGFQIGMQQVQKGGTIKFIIPSSLAYGCSGRSTIPGNAILFFEVQLVDVL